MMARHGGLFIREGSGRLPSRSRVLLLVDPGEDDRSFGYLGGASSSGDDLLGYGASLISGLRRSGCRIDLAGPEALYREGLEDLSEEALEELLAIVPPRKLNRADLPGTLKPADVVCFLCAGGPDGHILNRFAAVEQRILVLPRRAGRAEGARGKVIRRTLFPGRAARGKALRKQEATMREGWTVVHP
jgi:hypothetical protein